MRRYTAVVAVSISIPWETYVNPSKLIKAGNTLAIGHVYHLDYCLQNSCV